MRRSGAPARLDWRGRLEAAGVDAELAARVAAFLELLARFGGAVDLIGRVHAKELLRDHVLESLAAVPLLPERGRLLDLGSGGGFPAVPLLLARPALAGTLLEPRERRWAFLREVVRALAIDADVRRDPVTAVEGRFDAVTVRALGGGAWGSAVSRLLAPEGRLLWWTRETGAPGAGLERVVTSPLPNSERGAVVVWRRCST